MARNDFVPLEQGVETDIHVESKHAVCTGRKNVKLIVRTGGHPCYTEQRSHNSPYIARTGKGRSFIGATSTIAHSTGYTRSMFGGR